MSGSGPVRPQRLFLAACLYPSGVLEPAGLPFPSRGLNQAVNRPGPSNLALRRLIDRCSNSNVQDGVTPLVMAGDRVYVDATAGLFDPRTTDHPFERAYKALAAQVYLRQAWSLVKSRALLDDHEIRDNWEPSAHPGRQAALWRLRQEGIASFRTFDDLDSRRPGSQNLWFADALPGGQLLFCGDTRTERSARSPTTWMQAQIMSDQQFEALLQALGQAPKDAWKLVATPSMLLPRRLSTAREKGAAALRSDAWDGYPASLYALLGHVAEAGWQRCVFLSGDEHIPCCARISLQCVDGPRDEVVLWSVHAGALYAPFPFANAVKADFAECDRFSFLSADGRRWRCRVQAEFPQHLHDGFVELCLDDAESAPQVNFRSARGTDFDHQF